MRRILIGSAIFALILISPGALRMLIAVCLVVGLFYRRCALRGSIRDKLGYSGSVQEDCLIHWCCSRCAICQEAREAKAYGLQPMDFCTNQPLAEIEEAHERAVGRVIDSASDILLPANGSVISHLTAVSQLGRRLLIFALLLLALFIILSTPQKSGLLLVIFLQPLLILYIFYWRTRRQYASLDMVWKFFFVGFFLSTIQSALIEELLQVFAAVMIAFGTGINIGVLLGKGDTDGRSSGSSSSSSIDVQTYHLFQFVVRSVRNHSISSIFSWIIEKESELSNFISPIISTSAETGVADDPVLIIQNNIWLIIILTFLAAFVMAAGVEETMKVRCDEH